MCGEEVEEYMGVVFDKRLVDFKRVSADLVKIIGWFEKSSGNWRFVRFNKEF